MNSKFLSRYIFLFSLLFLLSPFFVAGSPNQEFGIRGVHLDLRIQVMKMPALKQFAKKLSNSGINTLIMEWEGTFPFKEDPLISNRFAYTRNEIKDFISYCGSLKIDVIPLQQSFGHVEYILRHAKYAPLREDPTDFSQVCPSEIDLNRKLFTRLFHDIAALHPSPYFHIGGDETHLLGHCEKCKQRAAKIGISRLYFDHIKMLCDIALKLGKRPVLWADIALKYPQYIHLLPKETIFVDWNYGWDADRFGKHEALIKSGYEIWGAPAIRSSPDNYYLTNWQRHFNNLRDFMPFCRRNNYKGIILTSWSTSGVYWPVYESENAMVDLIALRHVYPVTGFDILIKAYFEALNSQDPLNISQFIAAYCKRTYGFDARKSSRFQTALFSTPYVIKQGRVVADHPISLRQVLDSATEAAKTFRELRPEKNRSTFEHLQLMADIRVYYLKFLQIEKEVNADPALRLHLPDYLLQLKALQKEGKVLNTRFIKLNRFVLYKAAIETENTLRNQKVNRLYNQLAGIK